MSVDVLLAAGSFWPREGGAERQMRQVLSQCVRAGLTCTVVTQVIEGQPRRELIEGVEVVRAGSLLLFRHLPRLGQLVWGVAEAWHVLRMRPQTAVSIQLGMASVAVALIRKVARIRQVVRLTGGGTANFRSEPWVRRSTLTGRLMVRLISRGDVLLVSPAQHLLVDFVQAFPQHQIAKQVIPNGVEDVAQERLLHDGCRSGVVWYARGGSVKSAEAFMGIVGKCPTLPFLAIGRTEDLPDSGSVRRFGWVADPIEVMAEARVMLNTSPTEGMPNTALQALAAGMYIVGPPNEGLRELSRAFPERVTLIDLDDLSASARVLSQIHAATLLGPTDVPSSTEVGKLWEKLFVERMK